MDPVTPRRITALVGACLLTLLALTSATAATTQREVEESLTCQCGCGLTVHSCNHLQCGSGEPMKKEIAERLVRGEDKDTILTAFRARYGEKVLSSPTFAGFNWLAWITPFAAVLTGGLALLIAIRRRGPETPPPSQQRPGDSALRARLARELDEFDGDA